jgi:hypothetical protein
MINDNVNSTFSESGDSPLVYGTTLALYQNIFSPLFIPLPTGKRGSLPVGRGEGRKIQRGKEVKEYGSGKSNWVFQFG